MITSRKTMLLQPVAAAAASHGIIARDHSEISKRKLADDHKFKLRIDVDFT
jgi:hypothetical protein